MSNFPSAVHDFAMCRQDAAAATGQFSWRVPPGGTTGTVLAGAGPGGTSNARGPWAKTGMARARLEGLSFGQPTGTVRHEPAQVHTKLVQHMALHASRLHASWAARQTVTGVQMA